MELKNVAGTTLAGTGEFTFPDMYRVRQNFTRDTIHDVECSVREQIQSKFGPEEFREKRIAVTAGSRGIAGYVEATRGVIGQLKSWGAEPFVVPAMGSHGGATADGQREVLASYGITEPAMDAPVVAGMDVVKLRELPDGTPVYIDRVASEADGIVVINRVKPHTGFKGPHESGIAKMIAIGLGNHVGATLAHQSGYHRMAERVPAIGAAVLESGCIAFAVALVENAYDEPMLVEALAPDEVLSRERELLVLAKQNIGRLLCDDIDVLVIDEFGKEISGAGMDPNVTGRPDSGLTEGFDAPAIRQIVVFDLTEKSHGNATGIGMADVTTRRVVHKIDWGATWTNCITATVPQGGKVPVAMQSEREALIVAVRSAGCPDPKSARIVRIRNTLCTVEILVSSAFLSELAVRDDMNIISEGIPWRFDSSGNLTHNPWS